MGRTLDTTGKGGRMRLWNKGRFAVTNTQPAPSQFAPTPVPAQTPQQTPSQFPGNGQQKPSDSQNTGTQTNNSTQQKSPATEPKKKTMFDDLKKNIDENTVFSSIKEIYAVKRIADTRWVEQYTARLPKKPNFYRFIGMNEKTGIITHYLLLRGDVPVLAGLYRTVIDKFGHRGTATAKYFNDSDAMLDFAQKQYGIDPATVPMEMPDPQALVDRTVKAVKIMGSRVVDQVFKLVEYGTDTKSREIVELIFKTALNEMRPDKAVGVINRVKELSDKYYPIDLKEYEEKYKKYKFQYKNNPDKYKEMFDEDIPFISRNPKVMEGVKRLQLASESGNKFYKEMIKRMGEEGVPVKELAEYLKKMNALNHETMQVASEMAESDISVTFDIENPTDRAFTARDINVKIPAKGKINLTSQQLRQSDQLKEQLRGKKLTIPKKSVNVEYEGMINKQQWKKTMDYLRASLESYKKYEGKPVKPFEHKLRLYKNPETGWRPNVTPGTFRAELDMGDVYVPAPKSDLNSSKINEHFYETEAIAFSFVHELFVGNKKVWIVDEYQSDMVQQIGNLSDSSQDPTWYNPTGKSKKELYRSVVDNYYGDWYRVFFNKLIKKAKEFGVDEVWLIRGQDIYNFWHRRGAYGDVDDVEQERKLRLFRRVYDNTAIEYSQNADNPEMQDMIKKYHELVKTISTYYDALDKIDMHAVLTLPYDELTETQQNKYDTKLKDLSEEQKQRKLVGIDVPQLESFISVTNVSQLKQEMDGIMEKVSVMKKKTKDMPAEIYNGKYHVIDVNKVPDNKLAYRVHKLTAYASRKVYAGDSYSEWGKMAYDWIMNEWKPSYLALAQQQGEKIMSETMQRQVGLEWFWERKIPRELKTNPELLIAIRDYLRQQFNMPDLEYSDNIQLYIDGTSHGKKITGGDNPDPSYTDPQTSPMEENFDNRLVNPDSILYRKQKGRGAPYGDPRDGGELKTNLPASVPVEMKTANDVVERFVITREKEHATEPEIREELEDNGVSENVIENTYQTREKNLYKELT